MRAGLLIGLLLWSSLAMAQGPRGVRLDFEFSRVVLTNGDTLAGPVAVHFSPDLLYLAQPEGTVRAIAPATVAAFAVQGEKVVTGQGRMRLAPNFDPTVVRLFRTLQWPLAHPGEQQPEPAFFEQLSEGPVLLVRRQLLASRMTAQPTPAGGISRGAAPVPGKLAPPITSVRYVTITEMQDQYFLARATGEIIRLVSPKKDLLAAFPNQASQLQSYAKSRGLGYTGTRDLQELVTYANSLQVLATPR
jgi:hypothetical protein